MAALLHCSHPSALLALGSSRPRTPVRLVREAAQAVPMLLDCSQRDLGLNRFGIDVVDTLACQACIAGNGRYRRYSKPIEKYNMLRLMALGSRRADAG